jgi:flagellar biosynthesis anti-sigma factor FlgM
MKIKAKSLETQAELLQLEKSKEQQLSKTNNKNLSSVQEILSQKSDKVQLSALAGALGELSPEQIMKDRQAKVDSIKEQIKNGTYRPSSESIAQALAQEISIEILSSGGFVDQAEN